MDALAQAQRAARSCCEATQSLWHVGDARIGQLSALQAIHDNTQSKNGAKNTLVDELTGALGAGNKACPHGSGGAADHGRRLRRLVALAVGHRTYLRQSCDCQLHEAIGGLAVVSIANINDSSTYATPTREAQINKWSAAYRVGKHKRNPVRG